MFDLITEIEQDYPEKAKDTINLLRHENRHLANIVAIAREHASQTGDTKLWNMLFVPRNF